MSNRVTWSPVATARVEPSGLQSRGADAVHRDEPVPTRGEEATGVHVVRADGRVAPRDDIEPVAAWAQREVGVLR